MLVLARTSTVILRPFDHTALGTTPTLLNPVSRAQAMQRNFLLTGTPSTTARALVVEQRPGAKDPTQ
jgi:hypothetical protein